MAGWHDVIDTMLDLRGWWQSAAGQQFSRAWVGASEMHGLHSSWGDKPEELANAGIGHIDHSEPIWVSEDVFNLVDEASKTFEPEPLNATDLIVVSGFVLLPRPFYVKDNAGVEIAYRAFSWGPAQASNTLPRFNAPAVGTYLMMYACMDDQRDDQTRQMMSEAIDLNTYGPRAPKYLLWHTTPWWFGRSTANLEDRVGDKSYGIVELWKWLQVFFRLSMQQIITADISIPARPYARRAKRAGRDPGVLVVKLRRRSGSKQYGDGEGEGPDWQYQWLTRGHWRNQWYPSLKEHRQIWIADYIKGPEDKPFKQPDLRVWTFNR